MAENIVVDTREKEWMHFAAKVHKHVREYTVPQYGDKGVDQATEFTVEDCMLQIRRYTNRGTTGQRGPEEALRDAKKIAHYACMIFWKLMAEEDK